MNIGQYKNGVMEIDHLTRAVKSGSQEESIQDLIKKDLGAVSDQNFEVP